MLWQTKEADFALAYHRAWRCNEDTQHMIPPLTNTFPVEVESLQNGDIYEAIEEGPASYFLCFHDRIWDEPDYDSNDEEENSILGFGEDDDDTDSETEGASSIPKGIL
jgi:hypothetical protein